MAVNLVHANGFVHFDFNIVNGYPSITVPVLSLKKETIGTLDIVEETWSYKIRFIDKSSDRIIADWFAPEDATLDGNSGPYTPGDIDAWLEQITADSLADDAATNTKLGFLQNDITTMSGKLPESLGSKTKANSLSVTLATDMGSSTSRLISQGTTNATVVKNAPGTINFVYATNTNIAARFIKVYNKATAPTVGTDVPILTLRLAATTGVIDFEPLKGINCSAGISFAITGGIADSDTAAVSANDVIITIGYE